MRVVFMGTPTPAVPSLRAVADEHEVVAVYTQPDRPRGRGRLTLPSPVKSAAADLGVDVVEPDSMRDPQVQTHLAETQPDVVAVVAFGHILPPEVLATPRLGCVNVHFSLLPRWRGAAPVERSLMAGDTQTGVTTILMDEGLDTGPVLLTQAEAIEPGDTAGTLMDRLARVGADLLVRTLEGLGAGTVRPRPQPEEGVTYARKLSASDTELDMTLPAERLVNQVRALNPHPAAFTWLGGRRVKVLAAGAVEGKGRPGEVAAVTDQGPQVQTGEGRLLLVEVQPEGKRSMSGAEFVRGYRPAPGDRVGAP